MMDAPAKPLSLSAKKTRKAPLRRLEILRMRSAGRSTGEDSKLEADANSIELSGDRTSSASSVESLDVVGLREGSGNYGKGDEVSSSSLPESGCKRSRLFYGHVSVMGRRRVMEDAVTVAPLGWLSGEYSFFAVYDGHGGAKVAEKCRDRMHKSLEKFIDKAKTAPSLPGGKGFVWGEVMAECFSKMDEELLEEDRSSREVTGGGDRTAVVERMVGSTAAVVVVGKEELVVANCGDSRAVLFRSGATIPLSRDHKPQPDRPDEKERIEAAGGKVLNWNGWRVQGVLATSRSLGDHYLKPYVTSEPEVTVVKRSEKDDFLIIATDGLFDVVGNELACELVNKYLNRSETAGPEEAAAALAELALAKGSKDNISVIVVQLK